MTASRWFQYTSLATLLAGASLVGISANAHAQSTKVAGAQSKYASQDVDHVFGMIDTDSNGKISRSEAVVFRKVANYFDAADINHDGLLSPEEFETALNGGKSH